MSAFEPISSRGDASGSVHRPDPASTDGLSEAVAELLPALEQFIRFEGKDPAGRRSLWKPALDEPLPVQGAGPQAVLETLRSLVIPNGLRLGAPGFSGWVLTMPSTVPAAAHFAGMISAPDHGWTTAANFIEELALRWLRELLGLPDTYEGVFTSGGSVANLVGLGAARQHACERLGLDAAGEGLHALPRARAYAGENAHRSVHRALGVLGLGRQSLQVVPSTDEGVLDVAALSEAIRRDQRAGLVPIAVVGVAGDVNTGAVDPIEAVAGIAHDHGIWFHVDGAYGAFGILDERVRPLFGEFRGVDSLVVDPHKWMAAPVGCGAVFVRDRDLLSRTFTMEPAEYLEEEAPSERDLGSPFDELPPIHHFALELSAPSRGLAVWAVLKEIGVAGLAARVGRHLDCARRVADRVRMTEELELLAEPVLSICCFRFRPPAITDEERLALLNNEIARRVRARGRCVPSTTRVGGRLAIRPAFINPRTTLADADALVDEVLAVAHALVGRAGTRGRH